MFFANYLCDPNEFKGVEGSERESYFDISGKVLIPAVVEGICSGYEYPVVFLPLYIGFNLSVRRFSSTWFFPLYPRYPLYPLPLYISY